MTYSTGSVILDDDYNIFATGNAAGTGDNSVANINSVWGTGTGDKGYGQSNTVSAVSAGSVVTATQWSTLLARISSAASHQNSSITSITAPTAGDTISAFAALSANITTVFQLPNRNNANAVGTTITSGGSVTRTANWSTTTTFTHTVTWSSADTVRYFFNAGGRVTWTGSRSGGSSNLKNTSWTNLLNATGTLNWTTGTSTQVIAGTSYTGTTKVGGSGSPTTYTTGTGWYDLTSSDTVVFKQFATDTDYTVNYVQISVRASSSNVMVITVLYDDAEADPEENVDGNTVSTVTLVSPSTTYLTDTWGTPTISSSNS